MQEPSKATKIIN